MTQPKSFSKKTQRHTGARSFSSQTKLYRLLNSSFPPEAFEGLSPNPHFPFQIYILYP